MKLNIEVKVALNKNNPNARGAKQQDNTYNGKSIKPVLFVGTWVGQGRFMAAQTDDGKIIRDNRGKPIPYSAF